MALPVTDVNEDLSKIFVGGLAKSINESQLRSYFERFGKTTEVLLMRDTSEISKGFAFVTFESPDVAEAVLRGRPHNLEGREVEVKRAMPKINQTSLHERTKRIFLGGIGPDVTEDVLRAHYTQMFGQYGIIESVEIKRDLNSGKSKGFGYISFDNEDVVDRIIIQERFPKFGRNCEAKKAEPRVRMDSGAPRGARGGYSGGRGFSRGGPHNPPMSAGAGGAAPGGPGYGGGNWDNSWGSPRGGYRGGAPQAPSYYDSNYSSPQNPAPAAAGGYYGADWSAKPNGNSYQGGYQQQSAPMGGGSSRGGYQQQGYGAGGVQPGSYPQQGYGGGNSAGGPAYGYPENGSSTGYSGYPSPNESAAGADKVYGASSRGRGRFQPY